MFACSNMTWKFLTSLQNSVNTQENTDTTYFLDVSPGTALTLKYAQLILIFPGGHIYNSYPIINYKYGARPGEMYVKIQFLFAKLAWYQVLWTDFMQIYCSVQFLFHKLFKKLKQYPKGTMFDWFILLEWTAEV